MNIFGTSTKSCFKYFFISITAIFPSLLGSVAEIEQPLETYHDAFDDEEAIVLPVKSGPGDTFNMLADNPGLIVTMIKLANINTPVWKHTKAPVGRDILYHIPHKMASIEYGGASASLFFNMTDNMRVSANSLIQFDQFNGVVELLTNAASVKELPTFISLFRKTSIQEHKSGILFQGGVTRGPFSLQLITALQLVERNFWLSNEDQLAIKHMILQFDPTLDIGNREGMKIAGGLGDTKLKAGINTLNMNSFQVDLGTELILPTSALSYVPHMKLAPEATPTTVKELLDQSFEMIKGVRDYILEPRVGNNGHLGLGFYLESKIGLFHDTANAWFRLSYDKFFNANERRLFLHKKILTLDALEATGPDSKDVKAIYQYLQQYAVPSGFKVTVEPGGVFNAIASVNVNIGKYAKYALGYDFYLQQEENILDLKDTHIQLQDLDVDKTQQRTVNQHKLYTELMYLKPLKQMDMSFGGGGDVTVASTSNIGHDWTIYLKCASSF